MRGNGSKVELRRRAEENLRGSLARNIQCVEMGFIGRLGIGNGR